MSNLLGHLELLVYHKAALGVVVPSTTLLLWLLVFTFSLNPKPSLLK